MKFALHNYAGKPVKFFVVESQDVDLDSATPAKLPSHHIILLDVSGSMWGELEAVKSTVEKVLTAEEFNDPSMRVSLITYSSNGDCRTHFKHVTVAEVLAPNSPHLTEIRNLRVRGLTGISQALTAAEKLIDDSEVTCISLHTDGYANDPSPYAEAMSIVGGVGALEKHPNAFCNTVGYRAHCDYALLAAISNRLSGKSLRAQSARDVYTALHDTQTLLAGQMSPVIEASIGSFDFITFVSRGAKKVLGGTSSLTIRGLSRGSDGTVYRYKEVDAAAYDAIAEPPCSSLSTPLLAFCRVNLALGNLNTAKFALVSTRIPELIQAHSRALVAPEVASMSADIESCLFDPGIQGYSEQQEYGLGATGLSILDMLIKLQTFSSSLRVNIRDLASGYQRRGLKKVAGSRDDQGDLIPPVYQLNVERPVNDPFVDVSGIDINRDTATINIRVVVDGTLTETATGRVVEEVAGIKLNLKSYRNYTIVGDGHVNVPVLPLKMSDKRCFAMLKDMGLVSGVFDPNAQYNINLSKMPLVDYDQEFGDMLSNVFDDLVGLTVLQKILSGLTAGESEALTAEQIAALKECYISPALYFSPPTTVPYTDLATALSQGEVDTYLSYKVRIGTAKITNLGKLLSGNAYLQRRFTLTGADGVDVAKPTLKDWWADGNTWGVKKLSARTKLTPVDDVAYPIYAGFLGLGDTAALDDVLLTAHVTPDDTFYKAFSGGLDRDEALTLFKEALRKTNNAIDVLYEQYICPLAFYVGATGLVPDNFGSAMTADQLMEKFPEVSLAQAEKEGTFYLVPGTDMILGVSVKAEHFSTERGVAAAKALPESAA